MHNLLLKSNTYLTYNEIIITNKMKNNHLYT